MRVWLVQRAESTPHDDFGNRRLLRTGILADILQSKGHEVVWWTSAFDHVRKTKRYHSSKKKIVKENYFIHYLKSFGYKRNISLSRYIDNKIITYQFKKEIRLEKEKPDIILTSVPSVELSQIAVHYANANKIPIVLDIRDLYPDIISELFPRPFRQLISILTRPMRNKLIDTCHKATAISGITEYFVNWGLKHSGRDRDSQDIYFPMAYIKNDVSNEKRINAFSFWEKFGIKKDDKILNVLFLGTFTNSFEFEPIFLAAKILQAQDAPVRFIICGVGKKEPEIKKACENLNNCIFTGWVNAAQIKTILEISDVGLAPYIHTKNFTENIPNKPAEYLSEDLLVATSLKYGKLFELIKSKKCGLSYGGDPIKLGYFLKNLANDVENLKRFKKNANKAFVSQFDGKKVYLSMVKFLEELAKRKITYKSIKKH